MYDYNVFYLPPPHEEDLSVGDNAERFWSLCVMMTCENDRHYLLGPRISPLPTNLQSHLSFPTLHSPFASSLASFSSCALSALSASSSSVSSFSPKNGFILMLTTPRNMSNRSIRSLFPDWWKSGEALYSRSVTSGIGKTGPPFCAGETPSGNDRRRSTPNT